jgi:hypothetical protein
METENKHAGQQVKAFLFFCVKCSAQEIEYDAKKNTVTSALAAKWVRQDGWVKRIDGWYCSRCKSR